MTLRRPGTIAATTLVLLALAGCTSAVPGGGPSGGRAAASGAPATPDPVEACAQLVGYWAGQEVTPGGDRGLDYQEMGLSEGENEILVALLPTARDLAARQGPGAVGPAATAWARPHCRAYLAQPSASAGPSGLWPQ